MLRFLILTLWAIPVCCLCQKSPTYLSIDVGGNGIIASANIAKPVFIHDRFKLILQTGLGWNPKTLNTNLPFCFPVQLSCNFGEELFFLEAGLGGTFICQAQNEFSQSDGKKNEVYLSPVVGFRHEYPRWFGRMYFNPQFHLNGETLYDEVTSNALSFGLSIGVII